MVRELRPADEERSAGRLPRGSGEHWQLPSPVKRSASFSLAPVAARCVDTLIVGDYGITITGVGVGVGIMPRSISRMSADAACLTVGRRADPDGGK